jgi:hypothetical protein
LKPWRVRALLGAIGRQLGQLESRLSASRKRLNPFSRFGFGRLSVLKHFRERQAKEPKGRATV